MTDGRRSTLPAVLDEYLTEDHSLTTRGKGAKKDEEETGSRKKPDVRRPPPPPASSEKEVKGALLRRERSELARQQRDQEARWEKQSKTFETWQQLKADTRQEQSNKYKQKTSLQKELIRAREQLQQERKQESEQHEKQRREEERKSRQAKEQELQHICRESIEKDRLRRLGRFSSQSHATSKTFSSHQASNQHDLKTTSTSDLRPEEAHSLGPRGPPGGGPLREVNNRIKELLKEEEEEEEEENGDDDEERNHDELPWHVAQLHLLYGARVANHYLHPKIIQKEKVKVNPNLRKQGGRAGAEALWSTLRQDSYNKLIRADTHIPHELKAAYSAFARQALQKRKKVVKRNYYSSEDVPEMDILLDRRIQTQARNYNHKLQLMYRSSLNNQDRTALLEYNNPIPDVGNVENEEGVGQYLPSWIHDAWDADSEMSYKKWLHSRQSSRELSPTTSKSSLGHPELQDELPKEDERVDENMNLAVLNKSNKADRKPKYHFLTEAEATVKGRFSHRHKENMELQHIPQPHTQSPLKSHSSMGFTAANSRVSTASSSESSRKVPSNAPKSHSAPTSSTAREEYIRRYTNTWEPLSLSALLEHKDDRDAPGGGHFKQGQVQRWSIGT